MFIISTVRKYQCLDSGLVRAVPGNIRYTIELLFHRIRSNVSTDFTVVNSEVFLC